MGYFMIGFPTETYQEASDTVEFALKSSVHRATFMLVTPFAGTELAEMAAGILKSEKVPIIANMNFLQLQNKYFRNVGC